MNGQLELTPVLRTEPVDYLTHDGWPWAHGATHVTGVPDGWRCHDCHKTATRNRPGVLHYPTGTQRCGPCGRRWIEATYRSCPIRTTDEPNPRPVVDVHPSEGVA